MTSPDNQIINDNHQYCSIVRNKWGLGGASTRNNMTAMMLESQSRHFAQLTAESKELTRLTSEFEQSLYREMKTQLRVHVLPELCSIQPMTGPIGTVNWYQQIVSRQLEADTAEDTEDVPTVRLNIATTPIAAEARAIRACGFGGSQIPLGLVVDEALTEIAREVIGTAFNACKERTDDVQPRSTLADQVNRSAGLIHRESMRAAANRLIAGESMLRELGVTIPSPVKGHIQSLGVWNGRYRVYLDPLFPEGKLMLWYQSDTSLLDTGLIYSPYVLFQFSNTAVNPPSDMSVDVVARTRHKISLVDPRFFRVVQR
ncbi:MAG: hypothetical protein AB7L09_02795 [Nitrospira sp.]